MRNYYKIESGVLKKHGIYPDDKGQYAELPPPWTLYDPQNPPADFVSAQTPALEEVRATKLAEINAGYSGAMAVLQSGYPSEEVLSWERQAAQARELTQNPAAEAAFVRGLAAAKGLTVEEMCTRILRNVSAWEPIAAAFTGARQAMEDVACAAETVEELQAIEVAYRV